MELMKNVELDLVCRVCLTVKKEMRNLFGESVVEMLEEISNRIKVSELLLSLLFSCLIYF